MKQKILKSNSGFTLLEMLIVVTLFSLLMIIGTAALLNSNAVYRKTETIRTVIDNLHFVMEDMSRSIRTGSVYNCGDTGSGPNDCTSPPFMGSIRFNPVNGKPNDPTDDVVYGILCGSDLSACNIQKSTDGGRLGGNTFFTMTAPEIQIDGAKSGFLVFGAEPPPDSQQPRVVIRLSGKIKNPKDQSETPFNLQTTVSQRNLDS